MYCLKNWIDCFSGLLRKVFLIRQLVMVTVFTETAVNLYCILLTYLPWWASCVMFCRCLLSSLWFSTAQWDNWIIFYEVCDLVYYGFGIRPESYTVCYLANLCGEILWQFICFLWIESSSWEGCFLWSGFAVLFTGTWCVCFYGHMYLYRYTQAHTHTHTHKDTDPRSNWHTQIHIHTHTHTHIIKFTYFHSMCTFVCVYICICMYKHTHTHTHSHHILLSHD